MLKGNDNFYMIYKTQGKLPTAIHDNFAEAKHEAERITRKEGKPVYILETIGVCRPVDHPIEWEFSEGMAI